MHHVGPAVRPATVVLFDIDGTLVLTGGAGRRAMRRAFEGVVGRADMLDTFSFGGMTDFLIVRTAFERGGVPWSEALRDEVLETYLAHLADELPRATGYEVMPGVRPLLEALRGESHLVLGLGTGNIEPGGRMKLEPAGLNAYFAFGGFGSDAEDRAELLLRGAERGAALAGAPREACKVVVVGDTTRDITAARAIGATCVAVATGGVAEAELRAAGADVTVTDLTADAAYDAITAAAARGR